jgi:hypothetical protein
MNVLSTNQETQHTLFWAFFKEKFAITPRVGGKICIFEKNLPVKRSLFIVIKKTQHYHKNNSSPLFISRSSCLV